jgi:hypothetical protein
VTSTPIRKTGYIAAKHGRQMLTAIHDASPESSWIPPVPQHYMSFIPNQV